MEWGLFPSKFVEKELCGFAMGTAGSHEDLDVWGCACSLKSGPAQDQQNEKVENGPQTTSLASCMLKEHNLVLADDVLW